MAAGLEKSNGYEAYARHFLLARNPKIGPPTIREWAVTLRPGAEVLELACGHGIVSRALIDAGATLYALDASPTLLAAFRERFPQVPTECAAAEDSTWFDRQFDAIVAWGLLFLLPVEAQRTIVAKAGRALKPGGTFVFTAPVERGSWNDALTGLESVSLGREEYCRLIAGNGLTLAAEMDDEGAHHYYVAVAPV